jgi:hypothetical protein
MKNANRKRRNQGAIRPFDASLKDLGTTYKQNKKILERQMQSAFVVLKGKMKEKWKKKSWELAILKKQGHPIRCWERLQKTNKDFFYNLKIIK